MDNTDVEVNILNEFYGFEFQNFKPYPSRATLNI
jgi:hypothetical protein